MLTDVADAVAWLETEGPSLITAKEWGTLAARVERNRVPELLVEMLAICTWADEALEHATCYAWEVAERPLRCLAPSDWAEIWDSIGYVDNGVPAAPPVGPLTLYRGGPSNGWSWTDDLAIARFFAGRFGQDVGLYRAVVTDTSVLYARIHDPKLGRGEWEYVVPGDRLQAEQIL